MIKLNNLEKCIKTKAGPLYLLREINLEFDEGDFVTIMGPSGAGKSTLLSILGMYDGEWEGEFFLHDHAVHSLKPKHRIALNKEHIGFVSSSFICSTTSPWPRISTSPFPIAT
ncbi:MAG: putative ABC transport system ATP-binding protein [Candidatus Binatia bacterium]|jgi:putative ABC transport system ATP-binding protein